MTPTGIARKTRSDKGRPRNSSMDQFYDRFMSLGMVEQRAALHVLEALPRHVQLGKLPQSPEAPAEQEAIPDAE